MGVAGVRGGGEGGGNEIFTSENIGEKKKNPNRINSF